MTTLAFLLVILSAFIHASWNFATKKISGHISVYWMGLSIAGILSVIGSFHIPFYNYFEAKGMIYFILTGVIHLIYFLFLIHTYKINDFSSAYPVVRGLGVLGTSLLGICLLNENTDLFKILGICFILIGITAISLKKGVTFRKNFKDISYALIVGFTIICYTVVDKSGVHYINPVYYSTGIFALPALLLTPYVLLKHRSNVIKCIKEYKLASFIIGFGSFASYIIILFVFRFSELSYVVPVRETSVAIGALFGFAFLKEKFSARKVFAVLTITAGLILIKMS